MRAETPAIRVLGVDPGIAVTGYGVVDDRAGAVTAVEFGCVRTSSSQNLPDRLLTLHATLLTIVDRVAPHVVAVEEVFFSKNVETAMGVGQARGVVLLAAAQRGLSVAEYTPPQIKLAIAGYGGASKHQMQAMVQKLLDLEEIPRPDDAADALAVAMCHARSLPMSLAVQRALSSSR